MTDPEPPPIYTPSNLPFGWGWHSINGVQVEFYSRGKLVGEVKCVSSDGKAWHAKAHIYTPPIGYGSMMLLGNRSVDALGNFDTKQAAIEAIVARHVQHKLEGNP